LGDLGDESLILPAEVAGKSNEITELEGTGIGTHDKRALKSSGEIGKNVSGLGPARVGRKHFAQFFTSGCVYG
jgi:hypothetical protein